MGLLKFSIKFIFDILNLVNTYMCFITSVILHDNTYLLIVMWGYYTMSGTTLVFINYLLVNPGVS